MADPNTRPAHMLDVRSAAEPTFDLLQLLHTPYYCLLLRHRNFVPGWKSVRLELQPPRVGLFQTTCVVLWNGRCTRTFTIPHLCLTGHVPHTTTMHAIEDSRGSSSPRRSMPAFFANMPAVWEQKVKIYAVTQRRGDTPGPSVRVDTQCWAHVYSHTYTNSSASSATWNLGTRQKRLFERNGRPEREAARGLQGQE